VPLDLASLYEEHAVFVWRSLRLLGVPPGGLDDAVQEVFLVVHRRLGDFEGRSSVRTWLYAIARRVARNARRGGERRTGVPESIGADLVGEQTGDPRTVAERAEAGRVLLDLLAQLGTEHREVFLLVEIEEMTVPEAAEALGLNINTCYSRLRAARARFERALAARLRREEGGRR